MHPDTQVCKLKNLYEKIMLLFEQLMVQNKAVIDSFVLFEPIYMLRAWYRFYSRVFNTISRKRASLRASEWYGIKNEWIKKISGS